MSLAHPSEASTEDLSMLLAPDVAMNNPTPPSPGPALDPMAALFTKPSQPLRPLAVSCSEGNLFNPGPLPVQASIRARVEEYTALCFQEPNSSSCNALNKYTKAIMPTVHDAFLTALYEHIDLQLLDTWERCAGEKLLIQPFDNIADNIQAHTNLRPTILAAILEITQAEHLSISVPIPKPNAKQTPMTFLAYNLSHEHQKTLLDRYVWASSAITFRVMPTDPPCPDFLFSIKDLGTMINDEVREIIHNVWHDNVTEAFLTTIVNSVQLPDHRKVTSALQNFIDSLSIVRLDTRGCGHTLCPQLNIFAKGSIIGDDKTWMQVRTFLANHTYADRLLGIGSVKTAPFKCGLC